MHRIFVTAGLCLVLTSCGGGGSGSTPASQAAGLFERAGSTSPADEVLVLDSGLTYDFYGLNAATAVPVQGVAVMSLSVTGSTTSASDVRDFSFSAGQLRLGSAAGTLSPQSSIDGTIARTDGTTLPFGGSFDPDSGRAASLSELAGTYAGQLSNLTGSQAAVVTVDASGLLASTSSGGCSWGGFAMPHASGRAYDITITFRDGCVESGTTLRGHGFVSHGVLYLAVVHSDAPRAVVFAGPKT